MTGWTPGVVSNVWSSLLPASSLMEQTLRGMALGFRYVELRQGALGACEERPEGDERLWPVPDRLRGLGEGAPACGFNLAIEAPFWSGDLNPNDSYLAGAADAAAALQPASPLVRLVDPAAAPGEPDAATEARLVRQVAELAAALGSRGCALALENSRQPVGALRRVLRRAAELNQGRAPAPRLCWDPHNELTSGGDPDETAATLQSAELFEFHFKQGDRTSLYPEVTLEGELDWPRLLAHPVLREPGRPALFEIPPGDDIWQRLERSVLVVQRAFGAMA